MKSVDVFKKDLKMEKYFYKYKVINIHEKYNVVTFTDMKMRIKMLSRPLKKVTTFKNRKNPVPQADKKAN